jgi:hypothetical protein
MTIRNSIIGYPIDSARFSFKDNTFVAEASDLMGNDLMRQIYDDACDVGFAILSNKTRVIVVYYLSEEKRDTDGDITAWVYKPIPEHARKNLAIAKTQVVIFND